MKALLTGLALAALTQVATAQAPKPREDLSGALARWAPDVYQDTDASHPSADLLTSMDFDGDVDMTNNWEALEGRSFEELLRRGVVYTWATRTATHDFLGYGFYYPRDWQDLDGRLLRLPRRLYRRGHGEHENDMQGLLLVVDRARDEPVLLVTHAHDDHWQYGDPMAWGQRAVGRFISQRHRKREDIDGPIRRDPRTGRVQVFVQANGHGVYGAPRRSRFDARGGDGVLYTLGGSRLLRAREGAYVTGYRLESITPWWERFGDVPAGAADATFTRTDPRGPGQRLGLPPNVAFAGDTKDPDRANPPWGWRDRDYPHSQAWKFFTAPQEYVRWAFEPKDPFSRRVLGRTFRLDLRSPTSNRQSPAPRVGAAGVLDRMR